MLTRTCDCGALPDGRKVTGFVLCNAHGLEATVLDLGGIVARLLVPDRNGRLADVVLGFAEAGQYWRDDAYIGALVGRYANRIAGGRFELDGRQVQLVCNEGENQLHGGGVLNKTLWEVAPIADGVVLRYTSPDGEQGFPGNLDLQAEFRLTDEDELVLRYRARCDAPTPVNLSHHDYFNLAGGGTVLEHELMIAADAVTAVNVALLPTGEPMPVQGTPFDFRRPAPVGAHMQRVHPQLATAHGFDHNFILNGTQPAVRLIERASGRIMEIITDQPGMQFYGGQGLDGQRVGKGRQLERYAGLCLEPQHFPDSPNRPQFPSTILRPGQVYRSESRYRFLTDAAA
jgi:aldose 1-epimerase